MSPASPPLDLEAEYNNRRRVPDNAQITERWAAASKAFRASAKADLDLVYGKGDRNRYDLFHAAQTTGGTAKPPLAVFIHGGYWQRGDRQSYAFVARELVAKGVSVALPSYTLCPATSVMGIVEEMRQFVKALWDRTKQRPVIVGNSAGGHLTAAMVATDWSRVGGVPNDVGCAGYAISGVFDVAPLIPTSLNEACRLTPESARLASPLLWPAPAKSATLVAAVGGLESQEFIRQSLAITDLWSRAGCKAECVIVPGTNHFTVVDGLAAPDSAMLARVVALARQSAEG